MRRTIGTRGVSRRTLLTGAAAVGAGAGALMLAGANPAFAEPAPSSGIPDDGGLDRNFRCPAGHRRWAGEYFRRVRAMNEYNAAHPGLAKLYTMLSAEVANPEHPAHEYFKARIERLAGFITGVLESGRASGEIRPDVNFSAVANEILAIGEGFQLQLGPRGSVFDMTSALDHFLKRLSRDIFVNTSDSDRLRPRKASGRTATPATVAGGRNFTSQPPGVQRHDTTDHPVPRHR